MEKVSAALIVLSIAAVFAIGALTGLRINLSKTIAMCSRCKHNKAKCVECMANRPTYE